MSTPVPPDLEQIWKDLEKFRPYRIAQLLKAGFRVEQAEYAFDRALEETIGRVEADGGCVSHHALFAVIFKFRSIDARRKSDSKSKTERLLFDDLESRLTSRSSSILSELAERERRQQQGTMLSEIFREIDDRCSADPETWPFRKEIVERCLHERVQRRVAEAVGVSDVVVSKTKHAFYEWLMERVRLEDVNRSVFATLHHVSDRPAGRLGPYEPIAMGPEASRSPESMPVLRRLGEVVRWVIEEARGFCPGPLRLVEWAQEPRSIAHRDVRYHVEVFGCLPCREDLRVAQTLVDAITEGGGRR